MKPEINPIYLYIKTIDKTVAVFLNANHKHSCPGWIVEEFGEQIKCSSSTITTPPPSLPTPSHSLPLNSLHDLPSLPLTINSYKHYNGRLYSNDYGDYDYNGPNSNDYHDPNGNSGHYDYHDANGNSGHYGSGYHDPNGDSGHYDYHDPNGNSGHYDYHDPNGNSGYGSGYHGPNGNSGHYGSGAGGYHDPNGNSGHYGYHGPNGNSGYGHDGNVSIEEDKGNGASPLIKYRYIEKPSRDQYGHVGRHGRHGLKIPYWIRYPEKAQYPNTPNNIFYVVKNSKELDDSVLSGYKIEVRSGNIFAKVIIFNADMIKNIEIIVFYGKQQNCYYNNYYNSFSTFSNLIHNQIVIK